MDKEAIERVIVAQGSKPRITGEYVYAFRLSPFTWRKSVSKRCLGHMLGVRNLNEEQLKQYINMRFGL